MKHRLNTWACAATLGLALMATSAQAQQATTTTSDSDWRFFGLANLTFGGDTIVGGSYTNGDSFKIKAGQFLQLGAGAEYKIDSEWSASAAISYHFDSESGTNGEMSFSRLPMEFLAHYTVNENLKLSAGVRSSQSAKFKDTTGQLNPSSLSFKTTLGIVLEGELFLGDSKKTAVTFRYVMESFKEKNTGVKLDGNHVGIGLKAYF
jgi:hypothetical protein